MTASHDVFRSLVDGVGRLIAGDASQVDRLATLYAEDAYVVYFGAPDEPLRGRAALREHFAQVPERYAAPRFRGFRAEDITIHDTPDPEVIVAEFAYVADGDGSAPPPHLRCCFVMRIRAGEILETRDYVLGSDL